MSWAGQRFWLIGNLDAIYPGMVVLRGSAGLTEQ